MKLDNDSSNTIKSYIADVEKMLVYLNKEPTELNRMDIVGYINYLEGIELNAKTVNRKIYAIYKLIQFLNSEHNLNLNFNIKKSKMRIAKQEYGINILSKTDFKRILNASIKDENIVFTTLLITLYLTGMRISEALSIKVKDIKRNEILVIGKGRKQRCVPIPDDLKKRFKEYISMRGASKCEYLFINKERASRMTPWMADYWIKKYASQTKVELKKAHCHNIRHLFCYICLNERGMSINELAQIAGHSDINVTKGYTLKTRKQLLQDVKSFKLDL